MNTAKQAEAIFDGLGKNVMTPYRIECGWVDDQPYEIAEGEGFDNELIVGVTVLQGAHGRTDRDLQLLVNFGPVGGRTQFARDYIRALQRGVGSRAEQEATARDWAQ